MFFRALCLFFCLLPLCRATAQERDLLAPRSWYTPTVTFAQKYQETEVNDPDFGPTAVPAGSFTAKVSVSLRGINPASLTAESTVGLKLGNFANSHTLGEDSSWKPGRQSASFIIPGEPTNPDDPDSPLRVLGTITYTWTEQTLTATVATTSLEAGTVLDLVGYEDGALTDSVQAEITFAGATGTHAVAVTGSRRTTEKRFGTGSEAQTVPLVSGSATGAASYAGPKLTLVSPAGSTRTLSDTATVEVTTTGVNASYALNGEEFAPLDYEEASGRYRATLTLQAGPNHLEVLAEDDEGRLSATGADVFYTVPVTLAVSTEGNGSIVPAALLGRTPHAIGEQITVTAKPASGQIFAGWTGSMVSSEATLVFPMAEGTTLVAHFQPTPFTETSGNYSSSFGSAGSTDAPSGGLKVTVTGDGALSGQILVGGFSYAFTGQLGADGTATVQVKTDETHPDLVVQIVVDPTNAEQPLTGSIGHVGSEAVVDFTASKPASAAHPLPAELTGNYTVVLQGTGTGQGAVSALPGVLSLRLLPAGQALITGWLNDGQAFVPVSVGAQLDQSAVLRLYAPLYLRNRVRFGALSGDLQFSVQEGVATCAGTLAWGVDNLQRRPAGGTERVKFIATSLQAAGTRYVPPVRGGRVLSTQAGSLAVASETSDFSLTRGVRLAANGVVVVSGSGPVVFRINARNGIFTGSFVHPGLRVRVPFLGVVNQGSGEASGSFVFSRYVPAARAYRGDYGTVRLTLAR